MDKCDFDTYLNGEEDGYNAQRDVLNQYTSDIGILVVVYVDQTVTKHYRSFCFRVRTTAEDC